MAVYNVRFYDADPFFIFSRTVSGTANWTGPADADGKATINDTETGIEGITLDDDNAGGESATANVDLNGTTSTASNVDAEEVWTLRDTVTGEIFEVATFQVENGSASGYYTLSEIPLVVGRSYETLAYDNNPDVTAGDIAFNSADYVAPEHLVSGTSGNDTIDTAYTGDPQNDQVDDGFAGGANGNDNTIEALAGNDSVSAGLGDDTIYGGTGTDTVDGGTGDDVIYGDDGDGAVTGAADSLSGGDGNDQVFGEAGNDTILGEGGDDTLDGGAGNDSLVGGSGDDSIEGGAGNDTILGDTATTPTSQTEFLDWAAEGSDGTNVSAGFTQDTGTMEVSVSFTDDGNNNPTFLIESSDTGYVEAGESYDANSMLRLYGNGDAATSTSTIDFAASAGSSMSDEVENVSFRIQDVDFFAGNHQDVVTVNAYDADGNAVTVTLTPEGDDTTSGNTITAGTALDNPQDANGSVLVEIAGPVASIEIIYVNGLNGTQAIFLSEIYFDTILAPNTGNADILNGGAGDDSILGGIGQDTITGGADDDTMTGGLGDDVFVLEDGSGDDVVTDFDTGDDDGDGVYNDQLDVTNLTDADGNPVNAWDVVVSDDGSGNALLTFPNGETVILQGVTPAEMTGAQLLNAAGVPCFTEGTLIRTVQGDVPIETLTIGDRVLTLDSGPQKIRWIGRRSLGAQELLANPELRPIYIPQGVCDNYAPLCVSPQHGILLDAALTGTEVLARARHLAQAPGPVRVARGKKHVTYIHLMFDAHQIVFANGAASESFYPGDCALDMFPDAVVAELQSLIPGLGKMPVADAYGPTAHKFLKRREVLNGIDLRRARNGAAAA